MLINWILLNLIVLILRVFWNCTVSRLKRPVRFLVVCGLDKGFNLALPHFHVFKFNVWCIVSRSIYSIKIWMNTNQNTYITEYFLLLLFDTIIKINVKWTGLTKAKMSVAVQNFWSLSWISITKVELLSHKTSRNSDNLLFTISCNTFTVLSIC